MCAKKKSYKTETYNVLATFNENSVQILFYCCNALYFQNTVLFTVCETHRFILAARLKLHNVM